MVDDEEGGLLAPALDSCDDLGVCFSLDVDPIDLDDSVAFPETSFLCWGSCVTRRKNSTLV